MPVWLPTVAAALLICLVGVALQFYFKWVPEVSDQKRHVKRFLLAAYWALIVAVQAFSLYIDSKSKAPVTPSFVVWVAISAAGLAFAVVLIVIQLLLGMYAGSKDPFSALAGLLQGMLDESFLQMEIDRSQSKIMYSLFNAVTAIIKDKHLSPETVSAVEKALTLDREEPPTETKNNGKPPKAIP